MIKHIVGSALFSALAFVTSHAKASEDHGAATVTGEHLNLVYVDHTLAGSVADRPVYASPLDKGFGIRLTHRANEMDFQSVFTKEENGAMRGEINSVDSNGTKSVAVFTITETSSKEGRIRGTLDSDSFEISITSDGIVDNHFVNPTYAVKLNDKTYAYKLENGMACMGCSVKISYVILGMLRINGKI